ncbi:hypothetical protein NEUTE2DRAFT_133269 [Neurospora tetrasperma FGSC 2509]|nr:hypothetical protein NEUTE2DRAFT_133269 [Neurospora tetrasperma FGSC 2509]
MTDSRAQGQPPLELYPQYCFHLSPTINKWCHLRAADIAILSSHPGFQGQDLYFHLNHPIKWVRICGIVVAIDVYGDSSSRSKGQIQVITIDDSSGHTIECVIPLPPPAAPSVPPLGKQEQQQPPQSLPLIDSPIDIGHILDIKGSLRNFRDQRQVKAEKIVHLRTTEQEVAFWERVVQLRKEILDKPWKLDEKVVRRLRREAMGVDERDAKREKEKDEARRERREEERRVEGEKRVAFTSDSVGAAKTQALQVVVPTRARKNVTGLERKVVSKPPIPTRPKEPTGLERKTKSVSSDRVVPVTGKYTALGL